MSTNSFVTVVENDVAKTIYVHFDGDETEYNLKCGFNTLDKAKELVALGDLSVLDDNIHDTEAYIRDRGRSVQENSATVCDASKLKREDQYHYVFFNNEWMHVNMFLKLQTKK